MDSWKNYILQLKTEIDITETVSEFVELDEKGWGHCPFHTETKPSFHVVADLGYCYCFGCQFGGDVISFIRKIKNFSFLETVKYLSKKENLIIPSIKKIHFQDGDEKTIEEILNTSLPYYHSTLDLRAREYLFRRGLNETTIQNFIIGYDDGTLKNYLINEKKFEKELVIKAGLVKIYRGNLVDYFKNMIVLPTIVDGDVVMLTGRIIEGEDK